MSANLGIDGAAAQTAQPGRPRRRPGRAIFRSRRWAGWLFALPALAFYGFFNLRAILQSIQYSFYDWNGIGASTFVGFQNYIDVFSQPELLRPLINAFYLIIFFTIIPVLFGLVAAATMRSMEGRFSGALARTLLFLPQIIPGAAAAVAWTWMYASNGVINQILRAVGLDGLTRAWLGDFDFALTAVGIIGTWLSTGLCTLLLMSGIGKIDAALYEAARLDGANAFQQFRNVTVPGLRRELGVCVTVTIISALASFDVVYLATQGGPGGTTMVPGVQVYLLAFNDARLGAACALAVVLAILIVAIIVPLQRLFQERES
jgi:raffinose/stachyose/melibiose transport system permease protein